MNIIEIRARINPDPRATIYHLYEMYLNGELVYTQLSYMSKSDILTVLLNKNLTKAEHKVLPLPPPEATTPSRVPTASSN